MPTRILMSSVKAFLIAAMLFVVHCQDLCELEPNKVPRHILSIGSLDQNHLVLLTSEHMYELGPLDLNDTAMTLPSPVSLKDKWPSLSASPIFRRYRQSGILNSIVIQEPNKSDSTKVIFSIEPKEHESMPIGYVTIFVYDVESGQVSQSTWTYDQTKGGGLEGMEGLASVWIASNATYFYVLLPDRYGGQVMTLVRVDSSKSNFEQVDRLYRMCMYGDGNAEDVDYYADIGQREEVYGVYLTGTDGKCKTPWMWTIYGGIHRNGRFYLFGQDRVYSFSDQVKVTLNKPFPLTILNYQQFVQCPNRTRTVDYYRLALFDVSLETEKSVDATTAKENKLNLMYVLLFFLGMAIIVMFVYIVQCLMHEQGQNEEANEHTDPASLVVVTDADGQAQTLVLPGNPADATASGAIFRARSRSRTPTLAYPGNHVCTSDGGVIIRSRSRSGSPIRARRSLQSGSIGAGHNRGHRAAPYEEPQSDENNSFQFYVTNYKGNY